MTSLIASLVFASQSPALALIAKVTVIVGLALAAMWCLRRSRAALRHSIIVGMFVVILVLPLSPPFAPPLQVPVSFISTAPFPSLHQDRETQLHGVVSFDPRLPFSGHANPRLSPGP